MFVVAPTHHRTTSWGEHDDVVDANLGEFLHGPLGAIAFHWHEGDTDSRCWCSHVLHVARSIKPTIKPLT